MLMLITGHLLPVSYIRKLQLILMLLLCVMLGISCMVRPFFPALPRLVFGRYCCGTEVQPWPKSVVHSLCEESL